MIPRLYIQTALQEPGETTVEATLLLSQEHLHYLLHVMRYKRGGLCMVFNGHSGLWEAVFDPPYLVLTRCVEPQPPAPLPLYVFFSPIKRQEWILEKCTELGATHFCPILCTRSVVRKWKPERHQKIVHEACEQSHRLHVPVVQEMVNLSTALQNWCGTGTILDPQARNPLWAYHKPKSVWIGPEGGWTPQEQKLLESHPTLQRAHMGPHILRAETAAVAAVAHMLTLE